MDPNEKTGPNGFSDQAFVPIGQLLPYTVYFENDKTATAAARRVIITDQLDGSLDWASFEQGQITFGFSTVQIPAGTSDFQTDVAIDGWTYDDINGWHTGETPLVCHVSTDLNETSGLVTWTIDCRDPVTGLPPEDAYAGFLPPNDDPPVTKRGEGQINYVIKPRVNLAGGTEIRNVAYIQFDSNPIIATNQRDPHDPSQGTDPNKEALVTMDAAPPTSLVASLPANTSAYPLRVEWTGQDDPGGSGIASYDIYLSMDGGPWALWLSTSELSAEFSGQPGHVYAFYSVASDNVGHREAAPATSDATTGTPIQAPGELNLGEITATTLLITDLGTANMGSVEHAILEQVTGKYVGGDGRLTTDPVWQPLDGWAGTRIWGNLSPETEYRFQVKAQAAGAETEFGPVVTVITSLRGDASGDAQIDGADKQIVKAAMGSTPGQPTWDPRADLNGDNQVTADDLKLVQLARVDHDHDGDVDQDDFGHLQVCLTGEAGEPITPACGDADFNDDGKIDQDDLELFERCASGPAIPINPGCVD